MRAQVAERGAVRYTPAGLPAIDLVLQHESTVAEAGAPRKVSMQIRAVAIGSIVQRVAQLAAGGEADFDGFVAAARNGRGIVFHLTAFDAAQTPHSHTNT